MVSIRPAVRADLPALGAIYSHWVRTSAVTFDVDPREGPGLDAWFDQFSATGRHRLLVLEDDEVWAYASSHRFRPKPAYDTTVELTVYVHPDRLGHGFGARLTDDLLALLGAEDVHRLLAVIARPNPASERLFRDRGFREAGVLPEVGFKLGRYWDVVWYERPNRRG